MVSNFSEFIKTEKNLTTFHNVFAEGGNVAPSMAKDIGPPKFISAFTQSSSEYQEGQSCHLEARLTPIEDPNLKVEWFKDGKPLPTGHRFRYFFKNNF